MLLTLKLLMVVFRVNNQWFEVNINQGMLQPNNPNMKIYRLNDDRHSMLNDDLNDELKHKKKKQIQNKKNKIKWIASINTFF